MAISVQFLLSAYSFSNLTAIVSRRARKRRRRPFLNSLPARSTRRPSANFCEPTRSERKRNESDNHLMELAVAGQADYMIAQRPGFTYIKVSAHFGGYSDSVEKERA